MRCPKNGRTSGQGHWLTPIVRTTQAVIRTVKLAQTLNQCGIAGNMTFPMMGCS